MQPEIHIGPLTMQTFGICIGIAFFAGGALVARRLREIGKPPDWAFEMAFVALVCGLIGSRLDFMIENWSEVNNDVFGSLVSSSGLVWYGGWIGGALGVAVWARYRGFLKLTLLDVCAPAVPLGYAIGRVGCQLSGDGDYGKPWHGPWAMAYPNGTVPTTDTVHPTTIYETVVAGILAIVLWRLRNRYRPGVLFAIYLVLGGLERFTIEFLRINPEVFIGLTQAQVVSSIMVLSGAIWLLVLLRKGLGRVDPVPGASTPQPAS